MQVSNYVFNSIFFQSTSPLISLRPVITPFNPFIPLQPPFIHVVIDITSSIFIAFVVHYKPERYRQ